MATIRFAVTSDPLDVGRLVAAVMRDEDSDTSAPSETSGAVATFVGLVREWNLGRRVVSLQYEAHGRLAIKTFERIDREIRERWAGARLALHHRVGRLSVGEVSVVIAAAAPHRAEAFSACRYAIERVKQIAPIWKHEFFEGGDVWIEGRAADPDDQAARAEAMRRACG